MVTDNRAVVGQIQAWIGSRQRSARVGAWLCAVAVVPGVAAIVVLPAAPLTVRLTPHRPAAGILPWLSTSGGRIVDSQGKTVLLRGFNDDGLLQTANAPLPPALTQADAALMESEGFDSVRLPISWSLLEPTPGHFSQSYLDQIARAVAICASHRLYVILDMHTEDFGVGFGGSGAPKWLYVAGVPNLQIAGLSAAWQRHVSPAVNAALAYFWLFPKWQKLYWQAWTKVARYFRGDSAVAGYDLYNEPHPFPIPPAIFETRLLFPFYQRGIEEIGRVDPNHLFIIEGDFFGGEPTAVRPLAAPDLVYSTHLYSGSLLPPAFHGKATPLRAELRQGISEAKQVPAAYWSGELGIDNQLPKASAWARAEIALSNQYLTGWAWWQWDDPDHWGVQMGSGPPDYQWLDTLAQPFVQASPGRLQRMRFEVSTRTLSALVQGARLGQRLTVAWPRSDGTPRLLSGCSALVGYQALAGRLQLRLLAPSCQIRISG